MSVNFQRTARRYIPEDRTLFFRLLPFVVYALSCERVYSLDIVKWSRLSLEL
jgi:hypothetical protein